MANQGNTFDSTTVKWGHAKHVWREVEKVEVGGFKISNVSAWVNNKVIPAGTPLVIDYANHTATALLESTITQSGFDQPISGFTQEDVYVTDANTVATVTSVYRGRIYEYVFLPAALTVIKTKLAGNALHGIVFETGK